jgi:hypothetical protein
LLGSNFMAHKMGNFRKGMPHSWNPAGSCCCNILLVLVIVSLLL